ncbi:hypothetical protein GUJ93_ZPchr0006g45042 [Zizania palustris]|uniref:Uncharacterized protein n=1 Tax=Zizania palustris TaxID=103762 RepID=A0A8J5T5W8_ZIZPA|nr:hypothetical protein GUJ93_ZPchr0006g45042 [Zizania palustris]
MATFTRLTRLRLAALLVVVVAVVIAASSVVDGAGDGPFYRDPNIPRPYCHGGGAVGDGHHVFPSPGYVPGRPWYRRPCVKPYHRSTPPLPSPPSSPPPQNGDIPPP